MNKKNFSKLFSDWGKGKQHSFNNEILKTRVLDRLENVNNNKIKRPIPFWKIGFALSTAVVAVILVFQMGSDSYNTSLYNSKYNGGVLYESDSNYQMTASDLGISYAQETGLGSRDYGMLESVRSKVGNLLSAVPASDTREYLKTDYSLNIKSREVEKLSKRAQTTIRGYGGRIDSSSVNKKYSYIEFIVPKSKFNSFQEEIKGFTSSRYITESTRNENLLAEKRAIESGVKQASSSIISYENERKNLVNKHNQTVATLKKNIDLYSYSIYIYQQEKTTSTERLKIISDNVYYYTNLINSRKKSLDSENTSYNNQINIIDQKIKNQKNQLASLNTTDNNLMGVVETVQGSIVIEWISVPEIIGLYIPYYRYIIVGAIIILVFILIYSRPRSFEYID